MTASGFTQRHFELLAVWADERWTQSTEQVLVKQGLGEAYEATKIWAELLQKERFPRGYSRGRRDVVVRGSRFSEYTWWRIYPETGSPLQLAYTVGIDKTYGFIVKIDTYDTTDLMRARYLRSCGASYKTSPIWKILPAVEGLELSREQLLEWSIAAIDNFRPSYEELSQQIVYDTPPALSAVSDVEELREHFDRWRRSLIESASRFNNVWWVPDQDLVFDSPKSKDPSRSQFRQSLEEPWIVEINEPSSVTSPATMSTVAKDAGGRVYLLRRGLLQANGKHSKVEELWFGSQSGLAPISISGPERLSRRAWYVVAALSEDPEIVVAMTGQFVRACAIARDAGLQPAGLNRPPVPTYTFVSDERGGTYVRKAQDARPEQIIPRIHGDVSKALVASLFEKGMTMVKHRHPLGFEIDGVFQAGNGNKILVEIKTSSAAHDIHTAVGQLYVYPALMSHLNSVKRFLLLPSLPDDRIVSAVRELGIEVICYQIDASDPSSVSFPEEFLLAVRS
jgi:hypothetical protein